MQALGNLAGGQSSRSQRAHLLDQWGRDQTSRQQDAASNRSATPAALGSGVDRWMIAVCGDNFDGQAHGYIIHFRYLHSKKKQSIRKIITDLAAQIGSAVKKNVMYPRPIECSWRCSFFPEISGLFFGV